jgi:hypothetical protein
MWYFTSHCVRDFNLSLHDGLVKKKAREGIPIDRTHKVFMLGHHAYPKPLKRRHEPNGTRSDHLYRAGDRTGHLINSRTNPPLQIHKEDLLQEVMIRMCELTGKVGKKANAKSG